MASLSWSVELVAIQHIGRNSGWKRFGKRTLRPYLKSRLSPRFPQRHGVLLLVQSFTVLLLPLPPPHIPSFHPFSQVIPS